MRADLDDLVTALYVTVDELLEPRHGPGRPPRLSDAELVCLAVAQVLLGYDSERRWLRAVRSRLGHLFPYVCGQAAYNRRLRRAAPLVATVLRAVAVACPSWCDQWRLLDATPIPCGQSRQTAKRSALAGHAGYGYDRSHSRWYWGCKLYLLASPDGLPVAWCLANPKLGEREVAEGLLDQAARQLVLRPGMVVLADKGFAGGAFEQLVAELGACLVRPDRLTSPGGSATWAGSANGSRRSSTPSRASSAWSATARAPSRACGSGWRSGCWPWPRWSGATGNSAPPTSAPWSPTTTNPPPIQSASVIQ
jgi:Transposase DDE domain